MNDQKDRIGELEQSLVRAGRISAATLASRIQEIGFCCLGCGECCRGEDNSVVVFPREVRRIMEATGLAWLEVAGPPDEGEWDGEGCYHTLEWRLSKDGLSCRFLEGGRCRIYQDRPLLCRTYPFYLDDGILRVSECRGLGGRIDREEAERLAAELLRRYTTEIEEAISLLKMYRDFARGPAAEGGATIVHDSEGEHRIESVDACSRQSGALSDEDAIGDSLVHSLPSWLDEIPIQYRPDVSPLLYMNDDDLQREMNRTFPSESWMEYESLLERKKSGELTSSEKVRLDMLRREADVLTFRRGYATVLLKRRGCRLPSLKELERSN
ncbi:MAG TPA: YkgJ family cysteine cluster protein [Methanothrix sp.]|nr:YkgJ family cysteine cluster protein [Methanothrix sp.]HPT18858.1 YkgJ family cysteine cluster protein [Methanothrix sp.]